jgi:t-SNARE complex subunit (syntaxin)
MSMTLYNRDAEILKKIDEDVQYVRDMAYDLNELVNKQNKPLNNLQDSLMNIKDTINLSKVSLKDANDDNNNYNKKKILVGLTSGILLTSVIVGPYISIPLGLISIGSYLYISK